MGLTFQPGVTVESGVSLLTLSGSINTTGNQEQIWTPSSTNLGLGTSAFTIEGWFKPTAKTRSNPTLINNGNFNTNKWQMNDRNGTNTKFDFSVYNFNSAGSVMNSATTPVNGTWYYISVVRSGSTFRMHINGVQEATYTNAGTVDAGGSQTIYIAKDASQTVTSWNGQFTNVRVVIGTALYGAASYTPPVSPNLAVVNTQLLINAYPSQPFKDYSANNWTMNVSGTRPTWSANTPLTNQYSQ